MPKLNLLPQRLPQGFADRMGRSVGALGVTPNMISLFGFAGNVLAAYLIVREALPWAGVVFLVFSALDMVDGAVARATGTVTRFGAVFDAILDRASEALVLSACAWYFGERGEDIQAALTFAALLGSVAVSYLRARAEGEGVTMREGFFRRQERVAVIGVALLANALTVAMGLLAVAANLTAFQRAYLLGRALLAQDRRPAGR